MALLATGAGKPSRCDSAQPNRRLKSLDQRMRHRRSSQTKVPAAGSVSQVSPVYRHRKSWQGGVCAGGKHGPLSPTLKRSIHCLFVGPAAVVQLVSLQAMPHQ